MFDCLRYLPMSGFRVSKTASLTLRGSRGGILRSGIPYGIRDRNFSSTRLSLNSKPLDAALSTVLLEFSDSVCKFLFFCLWTLTVIGCHPRCVQNYVFWLLHCVHHWKINLFIYFASKHEFVYIFVKKVLFTICLKNIYAQNNDCLHFLFMFTQNVVCLYSKMF